MKDLILISNYSDTPEKLDILRNLVNQINSQSKFFDLLVVSHTTIPLDIQDKCEYVLFDSKNELLYDWDLRSKPWFDPDNQRPILSIFTGFFNSHLAIWRMIILGNSLAKNLGYNKVHHIEYDTQILDFKQLYENSALLESYDSIYYNKSEDTVDDILFGTYQAYRLDTLHPELLKLDEESLKNKIRNSNSKSPEGMLKTLLSNNKKCLVKDKILLDTNNNQFGLSHNSKSIAWCLPFYDKKTNELNFIVWNSENIENLNITLVYNDTFTFVIKDLGPGAWRIINLDLNFDNAQSLIILTNNKVRNKFDFTKNKEHFKQVSFRQIKSRK